MSGFAYRAALGLAAIGLAFPASAQQPSAPKTVWALTLVDEQCAISTGFAQTVGFAVQVTPGDPEPGLHLIASKQIFPGKLPARATIVLEPSGQTYQTKPYMKLSSSPSREILVPKLPAEFLSAFEKAEEVRLVTSNATVRFPVKGASKAAAALRQCIEVKLSDWGMDPKAYFALRRPPMQVTGQVLIASEEYPPNALANNEQGRVVARLDVDTNGKVTRCVVVVSSSSRNLDRATCTIAALRWRFYPAVAADGSITAAQRIMNINFRIMDSTAPDLFKGMSGQ